MVTAEGVPVDKHAWRLLLPFADGHATPLREESLLRHHSPSLERMKGYDMKDLPIIANLRKAARDRQLTTIGGGVFAPVEVAQAADILELAPDLCQMVEVLRMELEQLHAHHYPKCEGGCPADSYLNAAKAVLTQAQGVL